MLYRTLHRLWRLLPRERRQALFYALTSGLAPRPSPLSTALPRLIDGPVTVAGLLSTTTGLGEGARLCLDAFQRLGFDTRAADLSAAFDQADMPGNPAMTAPPPAPGEGGSLIVHINSPYLPFAFWHLGADAVRGRRVIAYWAWELPQVPLSWRRGLPFVHEIWVPSRFTARAIMAQTDLPVRVVHHPLSPPRPAPLGRVDFGLPESAFVAVAFFHMGSSFTRKNPLAAVTAFRRAFGDDPDRILVLKAVDPDLAPWARDRLENAIVGASNIRVLDRRLTGGEVTALLALSDTVVSLHRAEGFGLVPAQAMQLGKPVVATGWSGNLDFMDADNSLLVGSQMIPAEDPQGTYGMPGQSWADPDVDEAAAYLRRLAADPGFARALGERAREDAARSFGLDAYRAAMMAAPGG
jgi:glycosyltransferase involved in cell wall biosynthesis